MEADATRFTLAHVTHEAVDHLGGIGTVLHGLMTSPLYRHAVHRSILVGPTQAQLQADPEVRLGEHGKVLYSSIDGIDRAELASRFRPIEWAFNVAIVYGTRHYTSPGEDRTGQAEVLLIDVFQANVDRLNVFKLRLWETFGLDSSRYDHQWDYEEYVRLAEPAFYALAALLDDAEMPCVVLSHEFMGMPAALAAMLDGPERFRTIFYAHECATARHLVEHHDGHDTMFYNVLDRARQHRQYVDDVFGDRDHLFRHALIKRAHLCDAIIAVGDKTADEMRFLEPHFEHKPIEVVYNGIPAAPVTLQQKTTSRQMLAHYAETLLGRRPDALMTHVARPVISKGLWRDLHVCHHLDAHLRERQQLAVLFILTTGGGVRRTQDVRAMEEHYGWPRNHRSGYPDLVGPEQGLWHDIDAFNQNHQAVQIILVNQFGWSATRIGKRLPPQMTIADLRRATDVEFGMATYEPFGISPLEPLGAGAICVISTICGCRYFIEHAAATSQTPNILVADFMQLDAELSVASLDELKAMTREQRDAIERPVCRRVANELINRLPWTDTQRTALIESGQSLVQKMGWDQVISQRLLPLLKNVVAEGIMR